MANPLGLGKACKPPQQIAQRIAQLAIAVRGGGQHLFADTLVLGIVHHGCPEADDLSAAILDNRLGLNRIAQRLGHLLALVVQGHAMGDDRLIRGLTARAAGLQKAGLEPAPVLIRAL